MSDEQKRRDNHFEWLGSEYKYSPQINQESQSSSEPERNSEPVYTNSRTMQDTQEHNFGPQFSSGLTDEVKAYVDESVKKSKPKYGFLKGLALVVIGSLIGSLIGPELPWNSDVQTKIEEPAQKEAINISAKEEYNIESAVAKKATPSVVGIQVNVERMGGFWNDQIIEGQSIGSGVIVSEDGYILTNAHVVADARKDKGVNVLFSDNSKADAKVLFEDSNLDLAVIKVNKTGLTPIELGDSEKVAVGDKAIAIGNPVGLNLQSTLTSGYISGVNRSIQMQDGFVLDGLFQTDAAINAGNSGGALLNKNAQLVGINTAKVQSTDGIGFAIPINVAKPIINSFIETGRFESVQLGIRGVNLDVYKQYTGFEDENFDKKGVVIVDIDPNGNAAGTDLKENDIIISINGETIESMNKLKQILLTISKGDKATVRVYRDKVEKDITIEFKGQSPNA